MAHSSGHVLSIPNGKLELILIMLKDFYLSKKILPILQRLKLEVLLIFYSHIFLIKNKVKEAGATTKEDLRMGIHFWLHYNLAPKFCFVGENFFFLNNPDGCYRAKKNWNGPALKEKKLKYKIYKIRKYPW